MNNIKIYLKILIVLYWIVGLVFIGVFIIGVYLFDLLCGLEKMELVVLYKFFGVLILLIVFVWVFW